MTGIRKSFSGAAVATALTSSITNSSMSFGVNAISNWPDTAVGPFVITIDRGSGTLEEKILVASYAGTTVTVSQRGYDGTTAQAHGLGATVNCTLDANTVDQANDVVNGVGTVAPTTSAVGDAATDGTNKYPAAADHRHGRESFATGASTASNPGNSSADGTSASPARADHGHAVDPWGTVTQLTTSAVGDAKAVGSAAAFARADHKHGREGFGAGISSLSVPGDTQADGTSVLLARADHKHGREAGMRTGQITVINATTPPTVDVSFGATTVNNIPFAVSYYPVVTDTVYVTEIGGGDSTPADLFVLGRASAAGALDPHLAMFGAGGAVVGTSPLANSGGFLLQSAIYVGSTDSFGDMPVTFPAAFPNGVVGVIAELSDVAAGFFQKITVPANVVSKTGFTAEVWQGTPGSTLSRLASASSVAAFYLAIGF